MTTQPTPPKAPADAPLVLALIAVMGISGAGALLSAIASLYCTIRDLVGLGPDEAPVNNLTVAFWLFLVIFLAAVSAVQIYWEKHE